QDRRDDLHAVVVGRGVETFRRAAREDGVDEVGSDLGQLAGVLVDGRVLLAGNDRLDRRGLGVLAGDDRPGLVVGAVAHAAQRRDDAAAQAVIGREHAVNALVGVVGREQ